MSLAACALSVSLFGLSHHTEDGFRERNPGIGVNRRCAEYALHAGEYDNSIYRKTVYGGASVERCRGPFCISAGAFIMTGYRDRPILVPLPVFSYGRTWRVNMIYSPEFDGNVGVTGVSFEVPLP